MIRPIDYMQTDSRWASHKYAAKGERTTIKSSGCGTTCAAMVIASLRKDKSVTPVTTANWSMAHGYKAYRQGTYYSYFVPQLKAYGISCRQLNYSSVYHGSMYAEGINRQALNEVRRGNWVITCMGKGDWTRTGHFVLWYGVDNNGYAYINDPNSRKTSRRKAPISKFQYQAKFYFVVDTASIREDDEEVTQEQFNKMMEVWMNQQGMVQPGDWSEPARDWGYENKVMVGGAYKRPATREELIQTLYAYDKAVADAKAKAEAKEEKEFTKADKDK